MKNKTREQLKLFSMIFVVIGAWGILRNGLIEPDTGGLLASLLCVVSFGILFWFVNKPKIALQDPEEFIRELERHKDEILGSGWDYEGMKITQKTVITQYLLTMSLIVFSAKAPSRYYVVGAENTKLANTIYTIITFVFGWWGIPWGPIYTIQSLTKNLKGGDKVLIADLLND